MEKVIKKFKSKFSMEFFDFNLASKGYSYDSFTEDDDEFTILQFNLSKDNKIHVGFSFFILTDNPSNVSLEWDTFEKMSDEDLKTFKEIAELLQLRILEVRAK